MNAKQYKAFKLHMEELHHGTMKDDLAAIIAAANGRVVHIEKPTEPDEGYCWKRCTCGLKVNVHKREWYTAGSPGPLVGTCSGCKEIVKQYTGTPVEGEPGCMITTNI